jgi:hypothetical protein
LPSRVCGGYRREGRHEFGLEAILEQACLVLGVAFDPGELSGGDELETTFASSKVGM